MDDVHERSQFESRLPDDRSYWDVLEARIVASADPILRERRDAAAWWHPLARWSPAIGVAAATAALLVVLVGPPSPAPPTQYSFEEMLSPDDPVAQAVVGGAEVPNISTILLVESGGRP